MGSVKLGNSHNFSVPQLCIVKHYHTAWYMILLKESQLISHIIVRCLFIVYLDAEQCIKFCGFYSFSFRRIRNAISRKKLAQRQLLPPFLTAVGRLLSCGSSWGSQCPLQVSMLKSEVSVPVIFLFFYLRTFNLWKITGSLGASASPSVKWK